MSPYRPHLNPDAYTMDWLRNRADELLRLLTGGTKVQRRSPAAAAELAVIAAALSSRTTIGRRPFVPAAYVPQAPAVAAPTGAYTAAYQAVCSTPTAHYTYR